MKNIENIIIDGDEALKKLKMKNRPKQRQNNINKEVSLQ